ncbi:MAG: biotin--[acetyl-CoA-carboxylase] ligase, partial [Duncaniella sp.]|nr:biotin--[acetyl-CoA-carboxylase] ligase [Duncaniella sp.]
MTIPHIITLPEAGSTNTELAAIAAESPHGTVVTTRCQTAGRGQRGNTWEAAPGRNITMSVLLKPETILAREQFAVSEAVSLAIVTVLRRHLPAEAHVAIKWPNDIYVNDLKICGILIENSLIGNRIGHSIAGIGININQE